MNKPTEQPAEGKKGICYAVIAGAVLAIVSGVGVLVKKCANEDIEKPQAEKPAAVVPKKDVYIRVPHREPEIVFRTDAPDAASSADAGQSPPDSSAPPTPLEEACQNLLDAEDGDEDGAIYAALNDMVKILSKDNLDINMLTGWGKIAKTCQLSETRLLRILKVAIDQGNNAVATLVKNIVQQKCTVQTKELADKHFAESQDELSKCMGLPLEINPRKECKSEIEKQGLEECGIGTTWSGPLGEERLKEAGKCFKPYSDKADTECSGLPDFSENPRKDCFMSYLDGKKTKAQEEKEFKQGCPSVTAKKLGFDYDKINLLDATAYANQLATIRLKFLNLDIVLTEEDITAYGEALRNALFNSKLFANDQIMKTLGISNASEFEAKYIHEVADALRERGEQYYEAADLFEIMPLGIDLIGDLL